MQGQVSATSPGSQTGLGGVVHFNCQVSATPPTTTVCSSRIRGVGYSELDACLVWDWNAVNSSPAPIAQPMVTTSFLISLSLLRSAPGGRKHLARCSLTVAVSHEISPRNAAIGVAERLGAANARV